MWFPPHGDHEGMSTGHWGNYHQAPSRRLPVQVCVRWAEVHLLPSRHPNTYCIWTELRTLVFVVVIFYAMLSFTPNSLEREKGTAFLWAWQNQAVSVFVLFLISLISLTLCLSQCKSEFCPRLSAVGVDKNIIHIPDCTTCQSNWFGWLMAETMESVPSHKEAEEGHKDMWLICRISLASLIKK